MWYRQHFLFTVLHLVWEKPTHDLAANQKLKITVWYCQVPRAGAELCSVLAPPPEPFLGRIHHKETHGPEPADCPCPENSLLPSWSPFCRGIQEGQSEEHPPPLPHPAWLIPVPVHEPLQGRCSAPSSPEGAGTPPIPALSTDFPTPPLKERLKECSRLLQQRDDGSFNICHDLSRCNIYMHIYTHTYI